MRGAFLGRLNTPLPTDWVNLVIVAYKKYNSNIKTNSCLLKILSNTGIFTSLWHSSAKVTVSLCVCHTFQYNLTNFESSDILSVSNTYTNGAARDILSVRSGNTKQPVL